MPSKNIYTKIQPCNTILSTVLSSAPQLLSGQHLSQSQKALLWIPLHSHKLPTQPPLLPLCCSPLICEHLGRNLCSLHHHPRGCLFISQTHIPSSSSTSHSEWWSASHEHTAKNYLFHHSLQKEGARFTVSLLQTLKFFCVCFSN